MLLGMLPTSVLSHRVWLLQYTSNAGHAPGLALVGDQAYSCTSASCDTWQLVSCDTLLYCLCNNMNLVEIHLVIAPAVTTCRSCQLTGTVDACR